MKIAVLHNFMDNIGGAEIVTLTLVRELNADLYTTNIDEDKIKKMGFEDTLGRIFSIGKIPNKAPFRQQLAFLKFRLLNLSNKYDFYIISGDWAMSGVVNNHPNMWYAHSPLNELWEFINFIEKEILKPWKVSPYRIWVWFNRKLTLRYAKSVDSWVCNSNNTKQRIKKYYKKDAEIIYPPIETSKYQNKESKDYWLSVSRLVTHKRLELQLEAFRNLPDEKLIIVCSYEKNVPQFEIYKKYIEKIKPENVLLLHWVKNDELKKLYSECKGFITTSVNEDFGMTVIEAMASGKPVIAPNEGGYKETVIPTTGKLIDDIDSNKIVNSVKEITGELKGNPNMYIIPCQKHASLFDTTIFIEKIKKEIEITLEKFNKK